MPLASPISPDTLIGNYGTIGLALILFAECGLLIGFFLPGDTLIFSAGLLIATGKHNLSLGVLAVVLPVAAIIGNLVGYWIGYQAGPAVFNRPRSRLFKPEYVTRSEAFFERFGPLAVVLARFVPVVRTVATVLAGVSRMPFARYATYSIIGALLWADGIFLLGYGLGHITFVQKTIAPKIDLIIVAAVVISLAPIVIHSLRDRRRS